MLRGVPTQMPKPLELPDAAVCAASTCCAEVVAKVSPSIDVCSEKMPCARSCLPTGMEKRRLEALWTFAGSGVEPISRGARKKNRV